VSPVCRKGSVFCSSGCTVSPVADLQEEHMKRKKKPVDEVKVTVLEGKQINRVYC
jgi:hypothetical protein